MINALLIVAGLFAYPLALVWLVILFMVYALEYAVVNAVGGDKLLADANETMALVAVIAASVSVFCCYWITPKQKEMTDEELERWAEDYVPDPVPMSIVETKSNGVLTLADIEHERYVAGPRRRREEQQWLAEAALDVLRNRARRN